MKERADGHHFWNHNFGAKYIILFICGIFTVILLCWNFAAKEFLQKMNEENFRLFASLFEEVREQYPEMEEEEWFRELEDFPQKDDFRGQEMLNRYGIFMGSAFSENQKTYQRRVFLWGCACLGIACFSILACMLLYLYRRQNKINGLVTYIQDVEKGNYRLEPEENREDELSALQNELYKITVMLKESAELAGKQKKALADSVSDISHQLKTPLTSVMVLLDNLSESNHMEEGVRRKFLSEITRQLTNINWLVSALLKLSRLDAGVVEFEAREFSLDQMLMGIKDNLELLAEWKQVRIVIEGKEGIAIKGDFRWIGEAVANIVKNAVEHSPAGQKVAIRTEENAVYASISVKNWGEGISRQDQKHIFERFYRCASAAENSIGIGLSLAKEIVERQNGYLTVSSDPQNGTEFLIKFLKCH